MRGPWLDAGALPELDAGALPELDAGALPWLDAGLPRVRTWMRRQAHGEASKETGLDAQTLQAVQQPLKDTYRQDPQQAMITLTAQGELGAEDVSCSVATGQALAKAGLHPATGGDGSLACSGDMLLQALVACAGVTLRAVATSLKLPVRGGTVSAEGDLDFRGTLAVAKDAPVGFTAIRLSFEPGHRRQRGGARHPAPADSAVLRRLPDPGRAGRAVRDPHPALLGSPSGRWAWPGAAG